MSKYKNLKKNSLLDSIPQCSFDLTSGSNIVNKCKFNFSYFDKSQQAGQDFSEWTHEQLIKLFNKLKEYSREPLTYWRNKEIGSGKHRGKVFVEYPYFPRNSNFTHPKHVPHQASWSRFRLEGHARLVGFIIPSEYQDTLVGKTNFRFDCNTFYVVFLDKNHLFWKIK